MTSVFDAHNHLQDPIFEGGLSNLLTVLAARGVAGGVVNGTWEGDWSEVSRLSAAHPTWRPSYGIHPWKVDSVSSEWQRRFAAFVGEINAVGEIGLDRWLQKENFSRQIEIFRWQLGYAAERNLPATIHCLRCWGHLLDLLGQVNLPPRGFLLHAYGGPTEMIQDLVALGAYFSFSGSFLARSQQKKMENFAVIPVDRILIETDAPSMVPPVEFAPLSWTDQEGRMAHHPGNLPHALCGLADFLNIDRDELAEKTNQNFRRLFLS